MEILSVNIAQTREMSLTDKTQTTGILKAPVPGEVTVSKLGLEGDFIANKKVHGGTEQAVYIYGAEDYEWWTKQLGRPLLPGTFGENITLTGFDSQQCTIGDRLTIGNVVLEISGPRMPCSKLAARMEDSGFGKAFFKSQRPGAYARVINEGKIRVGDKAVWQRTEQPYAKILDAFNQWQSKDKSLQVLNKILSSPVSTLITEKLENWKATLESKARNRQQL